MVYKIADNIISPLGWTTAENYHAVKNGRSGLRQHASVVESVVASLFADSDWSKILVDGLTRFESLAFRSITKALEYAGIDITSPRTLLIISTTKGNVEMLSNNHADIPEREWPGMAAQAISSKLGMTTHPLVVCNACISGISAIVIAERLLRNNLYDHIIVCGTDCQSEFIISGFQSFKALSPEECRPFDETRCGLNLGEAAATVILGRERTEWSLSNGAIVNDANHISAPSRTAEGTCRVIEHLAPDAGELSFINLHGTATSYNDQMESTALNRKGLLDVPVNSLKPYFGHTMGAAGILETLISMAAVEDNTILATRNYSTSGVPYPVNASCSNRQSGKRQFMKLISGFGGCNAGILASYMADTHMAECHTQLPQLRVTHSVSITPDKVTVDGKTLDTQNHGRELLKEIYRNHIGDYPKFFKMDALARLAFVASELLLAAEGIARFESRESRAVILFNRSSSIVSDCDHQESISDRENYFPSPSVFAYTLPNIATGEIAIRSKYLGETSLYVVHRYDETQMQEIYRVSIKEQKTASILGGVIDCWSEDEFETNLKILIPV